MIPIYFDDPNLGHKDIDRVSQIFVSDKAGKNSNERETGFITRTHHSIECLSSLPFIALLLDLNGKPNFNVSFAEKKPNHAETDRCLRIYASGVTHATFPFLGEHLKLQALLSGLISKPKEPSCNERLQALVKYGSTVEASHMRWETQRVDHV
jgi:hypothetical protein